MHLINRLIPISFLALFFIGGCASHKGIPNEGPTMQQVYDGNVESMASRQHLDENHTPKNSDPVYSYDINEYSSEGIRELENNFMEVPNPTIYMYVRHHISETGLPVPGYTTKLKMFKETHFALPGEIQ